MNEKFRILIICTAILFLCFVGTTSAETWYVDDDGGADFMKIQDAINNASVGDTIIVYSGVYYENVVVNKSVTLMGNGQPVIDAGGEGNAITLTEDGITLVGFTATNSVKDWRNVGIRVTSNNNTITGNDVSNNNNGDGIDLRDSSYNNISGNNVCNNNGDGIDLYDSNNNIIKGNNVCNNNGDGIYFGDSSYNTISGNNVCNNDDGIFFIFNYFGDSSYNTISGNNVCNNNDDGIYFGDSSYNTISGNNVCNNNYGGIGLDTITGNNVSNNEYSISLSDSNNNTITGNNVSNNEYGGIYLGDSSNNNSITGNTFVNNGLRVSNSYQNTVEGNIVNGKPLVYLEDVSDYKVEDAGQVILVNCSNITVENLDLSNTSVGIDLWETEASIISNNKVRNNSRNGICLTSSGNNTITGNNVSNNRYGLGLGDSSYNTITGNNVCNNNDDGIYFGDSSYNTISGNNVCNNNYGGIGLERERHQDPVFKQPQNLSQQLHKQHR
jgi:parallel beta-helix repeat protein